MRPLISLPESHCTLDKPLNLCITNLWWAKILTHTCQAPLLLSFCLILKRFIVLTQVTLEQCYTLRERKEVSK